MVVIVAPEKLFISQISCAVGSLQMNRKSLFSLRSKNWELTGLSTFQAKNTNKPTNLGEDVTIQSIGDSTPGCKWVQTVESSDDASENQDPNTELSG